MGKLVALESQRKHGSGRRQEAVVAPPIEGVLALWREGERLFQVLPGGAPERSAVDAHVEMLRATYQRMTAQQMSAEERIVVSQDVIARASETMRRANLRLGPRSEST